MSEQDYLTVLTSAEDTPAAKTWRYFKALSDWRKDEQQNVGTMFWPSSEPVWDIRSLGEAAERISRNPLSHVIRGKLEDSRPSTTRRRAVRRKKLTKGLDHGFIDVPRRWLMIDIDGWPIPDSVGTSGKELAEAAIATLLPLEFQDVTCLWQFSGSAGFRDPKLLRMHLWFWLDRPVENKPLERWLKELHDANVANGHGKSPDYALARTVQMHFCADPVVVGGADPIPQRSGWLTGGRDDVAVPDLKRVDLGKVHREQAAVMGLSPSQAASMEAHLTRMGDDANGGGFHDVILAATWAYARSTPTWERDRGALKEKIRKAVSDAPRGPDRLDSEIDKYLSDEWLDVQISGAFNKQPLVTGVRWQACEPDNQLPTLTVTEARAAMITAEKEFLSRLVAISDEPCFAEGSPEPLGSELGEKQISPRQGLIASELGLGKSTELQKLIGEFIPRWKANGEPYKVVIAVPYHKLGRQMVKYLEERGLNVVVWYGREYELPDGTTPACANTAIVAQARKASADIDKQVCNDGKRQCPFHPGCYYQKTRAAAKHADVVICAHDLLRHKLPKEIKHRLALIVLEEGFLGEPVPAKLRAETFSTDITLITNQPCFKHNGMTDFVATDELVELRELMPTSYMGYVTRDILEAAGLSVARCNGGVGLEQKRYRKPQLHPGMSLREVEKVATDCHLNRQVSRFVALWECCAELLAGLDDVTGRVELFIDRTAEGDSLTFGINRLNNFNKECLDFPILCLDRTANIEIARRYLPRIELLASGTPITPHVVIRQMPDSAFSLTNMRKNADLVQEIVDWVQAQCAGETACVITHREFETAFHRIPSILTMHFGSVAGRNDAEHVRHLFIIGQQNPSPDDTRKLAACVTGNPVPPKKWISRTGGILMADGTGIELAVSRFADPDAEAMRAQVAEASIIQAVGRGRAVNRTETTPLTIHLLSKIILPWPINVLLRWEDQALGLRERTAARGIEFECPDHAAPFYPDLFPRRKRDDDLPDAPKYSREGARKAYQRAKERVSKANNWDIPFIGTFYKGNVLVVGYKLSGRNQKPHHIWCHNKTDLEGLRNRLEAALGCSLDYFRVQAATLAQVPVPSPVAPSLSQLVYVMPNGGPEFVPIMWAGSCIIDGKLGWASPSVIASLTEPKTRKFRLWRMAIHGSSIKEGGIIVSRATNQRKR